MYQIIAALLVFMQLTTTAFAQLSAAEEDQESKRTGDIEVLAWGADPDQVLQTSADMQERLGRATLREVSPLTLRNPDGVGVDSEWTDVTLTVYDTYLMTPILPGHTRILVLKIRDANGGIDPEGDVVRYRLFFPWVQEPGSAMYNSRNYWGNTSEGGWTTFMIQEANGGSVANPNPRNRHGENYFRVQCRALGCAHVVYDSVLLVYDVRN